MFSRRLIKPELLDHASPDEARLNLADLIQINRKLGGYSVLRKVLAQVSTKEDRFTLLDIGAASGDAGRLIKDLYPYATVTSLDYNSVNLAWASQPKVIADAFNPPFSAESFDYVLSSLFLHHFPDEQVILLLGLFHSLARKALLVCDLERHPLPYFFLPATRLMFGWQQITLHDGPISVRASFRPNELLELSAMAGIKDAQADVHRPAFRVSLIARKRQDQARK